MESLAFAWALFIVVRPLLACGLLVLPAVAGRLPGQRPSAGVLVGVGAIIAPVVLIAWGAPGVQDTHRGAVAVNRRGRRADRRLLRPLPFALRGSRLDTVLTPVPGSACGFAATQRRDEADGRRLRQHPPPAGGGLDVVAAVAGFAATVTGMTAPQRAPATMVVPISTAVQTFLPVALEPVFLAESFREADPEGPSLLVGLVVMSVGIVIVARSGPVSALAAGMPMPPAPRGRTAAQRGDGGGPAPR